MPELNIDSIVKDYTSGPLAGRPPKPSSYKTKYPSRTSPNDKNQDEEIVPHDKKWYQKQAEWLWWMFSNNYTDFNYSGRAEMVTNRLYAQGRQPIDKYMSPFAKWNQQANRWETWLNISFDIFAIIPKFISWVMGDFDKVDYNVSVHSVDEFAGTEKMEQIWQQVSDMQDEGFHQAANMMMGTEPEQPDQPLPFTPTSMEQAQMLIDMGFIKVLSEAAIEKLLKQSADDSRWKETIKPKLHYDSMVLARIAVKDYVDKASGRIMTRYVDPVNLIARYRMTDNYYQQISYAAEIVPYTIGDLRAAGIKGEELQECIKHYNGKIDNVEMNMQDYYYGNNRFNDMTVYVMDCDFEALDFARFKWMGDNGDDGESAPSEVNIDEPIEEGSKTKDTSYQKWHRAKWVIGTNIVFDYGFQFDVPYDQYDRPQSSFSIVRIADRSPVNLLIADADEAQNLVLKRRVAIAKARPPGTIFDDNALEEMEIAGKKFSKYDQISRFNQTGDMLIRHATTPTGQIIPGVPLPYYENKGGLNGMLDEYNRGLQSIIMEMQQKIGIPAPLEGSTPTADQAVGTTRLALEGTNNVLRNMLMGYQSVKKQTFSKMAYRYEIRDKVGLLKQYEGIVGAESLDLLKFVNMRFHGISVDTLIDDQLKERIMGAAQASLQANKTGGVGINFGEYFAVGRMVDLGLYLPAQLYIDFKEEQRKKEQMQIAQQNIEGNRQTAIATEEAKRETMAMATKMATESKVAVVGATTEGKIVINEQQAMVEMMKEMKLMMEQNKADMAKIILQGKVDETVGVAIADATPKPVAAKK